MVIENEPDKYLHHINGYGNTQDEVKVDEFLIKNRKYMEDLITTVSISKYNQNPMSTKYYLVFRDDTNNENKPSFSSHLLCLFTTIELMNTICGEYKTNHLIYVPWHWDEVEYAEGNKILYVFLLLELVKKPF